MDFNSLPLHTLLQLCAERNIKASKYNTKNQIINALENNEDIIFKCDYENCNYSCSIESSLIRHIRKHTG